MPEVDTGCYVASNSGTGEEGSCGNNAKGGGATLAQFNKHTKFGGTTKEQIKTITRVNTKTGILRLVDTDEVDTGCCIGSNSGTGEEGSWGNNA